MIDVIPILKKDTPFDEANYRPISLLPSLSKVYENIVHYQLNSFFEKKLSPLLCDFRSRYTPHANLNLINKWQCCLDKSGVVGAFLTDFSKGLGCLSHKLILAKPYAYRVDMKNLELGQDYLSKYSQGFKLDSTFRSWL